MAWWFYAALSAFFAALTAIFSKIGVENVSSNLATAIRTIVILIVAWGIVFFKNEIGGLHTVSRRSVLFLVVSGIATGLSWVFYFKALQMGKASQVAAVDKLSIVFIFFLSLFFLAETFSLRSFAGVVLIMVGTLLMIKP